MSAKKATHKIIPMDEIPERKYTKGSIYDDVIDDFIKRDIPLAKVEQTKKKSSELLDGTYLAGRLSKRLKERKITDIRARTINKTAYLQKVVTE